MTTEDLIKSPIVVGLASALVSTVLAYLTFSRKALEEIFVLKGMVNMLLNRLNLLDRVQEKLMGIDKDVDRLKYDLNNAWSKLRKGDANGDATNSGHG